MQTELFHIPQSNDQPKTAMRILCGDAASDDGGDKVDHRETCMSLGSTHLTTEEGKDKENEAPPAWTGTSIVRPGVRKEIAKQVVRKKLSKQRHLVVQGAISPHYLDSIFPTLLNLFRPQTVTYNGGIANIKEWKISCYLEVMEGGIPCTEPNLELRDVFAPLLDACDSLFVDWYRQQHSCNRDCTGDNDRLQFKRKMTFVTRYTPAPGEQALLKHVDGAGKVAGSVVVALPMDRWSAPEEVNSFEGHGGGLTLWDGKDRSTGRTLETHYDTRSGDIAFIDRAVWHQADPITKGTRWALVIFYGFVTD